MRDYYEILGVARGSDEAALKSAFRKLASLSGKQGGLDQMLSSHPDPGSRADRMRDKTGGKK